MRYSELTLPFFVDLDRIRVVRKKHVSRTFERPKHECMNRMFWYILQLQENINMYSYKLKYVLKNYISHPFKQNSRTKR